jgi:hypothetical protein
VDVVDGLATMYTAVLREHEVPGRWKQGQVSMLYKGKGASDLCTNYRGLTMLNVAGKIWERVALPRLERVASAHGAIHENQNGFRKGRSCDEHLFVLQQALEANPDSVAVFVDVRKAYPTVWRAGLLVKLAQAGVAGDMWAAVRSAFQGVESQVRVGGAVSEQYAVENGLLEGALLSPFFYLIFIDGLPRELESSGVGATVGEAYAGALYYADDLALLAKENKEAQWMLDVLDRYCRRWNFLPAYSKTKQVRFGERQKDKGVNAVLYLPSMHHDKAPPTARHRDGGWMSRTNPVARAPEYGYLGVVVHESGSFVQHMGTSVKRALGRGTATVWRVADKTGSGLPAGVLRVVMKAVAESQLRYGAGVWAPVGGQAAGGAVGVAAVARVVDVAYNKAARLALGVPTHTPLAGVYAELGVPDAEGVWAESVLGLWRRLARLPEGRLAKAVWEHARAQGGANSFGRRARTAHALLESGAFPRGDTPTGSVADAKTRWRAAQRRRRTARWETYVREHTGDGAAWYAAAPAPGAERGYRARAAPPGCSAVGRRALLAMRLHGHYLGSRLGALGGAGQVALRARLCTRCSAGAVDDEPHYWAGCATLDSARQTMLDGLEAAYPGFRGRYGGLSAAGRARALAFEVPDGRWGVGNWARGVRAVVQFGVDAAGRCATLRRAMWRMAK